MAEVIIDKNSMLELKATISAFKGGSKLVLSRSINDALNGVRTESVKAIGGKITAKATVIRSKFQIKKTTVNDLNAQIECKSLPIPLIEFAATPVKKGVSVKILKANKKSTVRHAFIATMKSGHRGVFWRAELYGRKYRPDFNYGIFKEIYGDRKHPYRYINELYGPRIPDIFDDPDIIEPVMVNANQRLQARLEHHTQRLIDSQK